MRARQSKFICINDNIKNKTQELQDVISSFYESFFPMPSQFEKTDCTNSNDVLMNVDWETVRERVKKKIGFVVSFKNIPDLSFYCIQICVFLGVCVLL